MLEDHYTGEEINAAIARRRRASPSAFPGETAGGLDALRELFQRKALLARQARVCQALLEADGATPETVVARRVADLAGHARRRARRGAAGRARPAAATPTTPALDRGRRQRR